jgi:predicted DNA repair protein MutK
MASSGTLRRVPLVRIDVSEELSASIIRVTRISKIGTTLVITVFLHSVRRLLVTANVVTSSPILVNLDDGGAKFLRNLGSYKSHTA